MISLINALGEVTSKKKTFDIIKSIHASRLFRGEKIGQMLINEMYGYSSPDETPCYRRIKSFTFDKMYYEYDDMQDRINSTAEVILLGSFEQIPTFEAGKLGYYSLQRCRIVCAKTNKELVSDNKFIKNIDFIAIEKSIMKSIDLAINDKIDIVIDKIDRGDVSPIEDVLMVMYQEILSSKSCKTKDIEIVLEKINEIKSEGKTTGYIKKIKNLFSEVIKDAFSGVITDGTKEFIIKIYSSL